MGRHNPTVMYCWVTCQPFVEPDRAFGTAEISQLQKATGSFGRIISLGNFNSFLCDWNSFRNALVGCGLGRALSRHSWSSIVITSWWPRLDFNGPGQTGWLVIEPSSTWDNSICGSQVQASRPRINEFRGEEEAADCGFELMGTVWRQEASCEYVVVCQMS